MSVYPRITVTLSGPRAGFIIAVLAPEGQEELAASAQVRGGEYLVTGKVYRRSADEEPGDWRAWLWPQAGGALAVTQSCDVIDAGDPRALEVKLGERHEKSGAWWLAGEAA